MKWTIATKQGDNYTVNDDAVWVWVRLENDLGLTYSQAHQLIADHSLKTITHLLWVLSRDMGKTDLPNADDWARLQLEMFDIAEEPADPKAEQG